MMMMTIITTRLLLLLLNEYLYSALSLKQKKISNANCLLCLCFGRLTIERIQYAACTLYRHVDTVASNDAKNGRKYVNCPSLFFTSSK